MESQSLTALCKPLDPGSGNEDMTIMTAQIGLLGGHVRSILNLSSQSHNARLSAAISADKVAIIVYQAVQTSLRPLMGLPTPFISARFSRLDFPEHKCLASTSHAHTFDGIFSLGGVV